MKKKSTAKKAVRKTVAKKTAKKAVRKKAVRKTSTKKKAFGGSRDGSRTAGRKPVTTRVPDPPKAVSDWKIDDASAEHRKRNDQVNSWRRAISREGRDIGPIPKPANQERRDACRLSFRLYCETYHAETFGLAWSDDHLRIIERIEAAVLRGGLFALAMPRGSGKTSLCECACLWSLAFRHRRFVALIGAEQQSAGEMLQSLIIELETNDVLAEDFPEVCYPIRCQEGITQRKLLSEGSRVRMKITASTIQLPFVDGSKAIGGVVQFAGITGRIRGMKAKLPDGTALRPDLVIIDDPQTDESAKSPSQSQTREAILSGAILGLAGPGQRIAGVMPCTVIRPGDMADRILDRDRHPEWNGERCSMVYTWPKASALWDEYAKRRREGMRAGDDGADGNAFYQANREAMDEGAVVSWPERFNHDELSAIHHAMNLLIRDEESFFAEYQNQPSEAVGKTEFKTLTPDMIERKQNGLKRGQIIDGAQCVTGFIDIQQKCLWWLVAAWRPDFTGSVVDYGAWPDPGRRYYTTKEITRTMSKVAPGTGIEGAIYNALSELCGSLSSRSWFREDGVELPTSVLMIDANWGTSTGVVRDWVRRNRMKPTIFPAHGRYVGATSRPIEEYRKKRGEMIGNAWKTSVIDRLRHVLIDTNFWKSFVVERLSSAMGDLGSLTLFEGHHRMLIDQLLSESRHRVTSGERTVDEWKLRPDRPDNHLFDCLVGSAVGASLMGCKLQNLITGEAKAQTGTRRRKRRRVHYM